MSKQTIDVTPTWSGILPAMILVLQNSDSKEGQKVVMEELKRMAEQADAYVQSVKTGILVKPQ